MANSDPNLNSLKNVHIEQLFKIIQQQAEQIEAQKVQINALIKSQQALLESMRLQTNTSSHINQLSMNYFNHNIRQSIFNPNLLPSKNVITNSLNTNSNNLDPPEQLLHDYSNRFNHQMAYNSSLNTSRSNQVIKSPLLSGNIGSGNLTPTTCPSIDTSEMRANDNWTHLKSLTNTDPNEIIKKEVADQSDNCITSDLPTIETDPNEDEEEMDLPSLQEFAAKFKMSRIEMGFTQRDVGVCLGLMQGNDFSQTTLSRFEALNLSYRNMRKLQPLLQRWLDDIQREGRDAVMARITAFYQQQKALVDEDCDNTDMPSASAASRKRVANESLIISDDLPDERNTVNADSTTMNSKVSQNQLLRTCIGNISNSLSPTLLNSLTGGFPLGFPNSISTSTGLGTGFSNIPFQSTVLHDQISAINYNKNLFSQKKRRKKILVSNEEIKSRFEMFPDHLKDSSQS